MCSSFNPLIHDFFAEHFKMSYFWVELTKMKSKSRFRFPVQYRMGKHLVLGHSVLFRSFVCSSNISLPQIVPEDVKWWDCGRYMFQRDQSTYLDIPINQCQSTKVDYIHLNEFDRPRLSDSDLVEDLAEIWLLIKRYVQIGCKYLKVGWVFTWSLFISSLGKALKLGLDPFVDLVYTKFNVDGTPTRRLGTVKKILPL